MDFKDLFKSVRDGGISPEKAVEVAERSMGGRVYKQKSPEDRVSSYLSSRAIRDRILKNRIPFITPQFMPDFFLCQGLVIVGAESGRAKSTTCANMVAGFLRSTPSDRTAIVITNEEAQDAVYERVACILLRKNYVDFFRRNLPDREIEEVVQKVVEIAHRVEVVSEEDNWDPTYVEDVEDILRTAAASGVSLVLVDYLQTITASRKDPQMEAFQISKRLGVFLKDYGRKYGIPVVTFVQLNPEGTSATMASRIQNDKTFYNHGFICIEIKPDFETLTTEFTIHKDRFFGLTGKKTVMDYIGGRYEMTKGL